MDIVIELGDQEIPGRLPYMQNRYLLQLAYAQSAPMEEDAPSDGVDQRALDFACVCAAAIGLCWRGEEPLDVPTFRQCGRDVIEYGEACMDALLRRGLEPREIVRFGHVVCGQILRSIPTAQDIKEATDPFEGQAENYTEVTS